MIIGNLQLLIVVLNAVWCMPRGQARFIQNTGKGRMQYEAKTI
jgi:hypothetical protein